MTDEELLLTILGNSFVKADVLRRLRIVREYLEQRFYTPGEIKDLTGYLTSGGVGEEDQKALTNWGEEFFRTFTKENAYETLEHIISQIKTLPLINLYIPIDLHGEQIDTLGKWFRENVDKKILVEIHVESSTFGGCAFAWNGVYFDYTLRHYMKSKMTGIRHVLDDFVANGQQQST